MFLRIAIILLLFCTQVHAKHLYSESFYQKSWCKQHGGIAEFKLKDNTRIDCLTNEYAIEFDFASKWAEAIGQSLHYSYMTNKKAGIVLIIENKNDYKYYERIKPLCEKHSITLWQTKPPKKELHIPANDIDLFDLLYILIQKLIKFIFDLI